MRDKLLSLVKAIVTGTAIDLGEAPNWQEIYRLAMQQGVLAIVFDALMTLPSEAQPPKSLKLQWIASIANIEHRYNHQRSVAMELTEQFHKNNIKTFVLKGLAIGSYYSKPEHRECGDFDCYLFENYAKGNSLARELGAYVDDGWYKHSEIIYRKVMIENHQYIVAIRGGERLKRLHNLLDNMARTEVCKPIFDTKIEMPSAMFNALFMNHHSLTHFLSEGIRLRHILDWALFLAKEQDNLDWERFYALCEEFDMRAFVDCSTAVAIKVFNIEITNPKVVVESPYTERVLDSILNDDDAVFSQSVGKWRTRLMLVRNLFASKWKYEAFANTGIIAKFVSLAWGYFTHPEED